MKFCYFTDGSRNFLPEFERDEKRECEKWENSNERAGTNRMPEIISFGKLHFAIEYSIKQFISVHVY